MNARATLALLPLTLAASPSQEPPAPRLGVQLELDQADAVLAILAKRRAGEPVSDEDWRRLETSRGYLRMKERNESFGNTTVAASTRAFLLSDAPLANLDALRATVDDYRSLDVTAAAERALAYLPAEARIRATIYPVVKERTNSYVYDLSGDPAIFLYVDPERTAAELENTVAHELHHVGSATCSDPEDVDRLTPEARLAWSWLSAFGEGLAMLAAAGSPDVHPHATSPAAAWAVWERDVAHFNRDVARLEEFFLAVLVGELDETTGRARLFGFINAGDVPQGAFYTVGWKMAAVVERTRGREAVVAAVRDPRLLLEAFNEVVREHGLRNGASLATWSPELLEGLRAQ